MGFITKLTEKKESFRRASQHKEIEATYFFTREGYLQIDSYGSKDRDCPGKKSQTMQFSPEILEQLFQILQERMR